ncbi:hypothetical protein ACHHYP_04479 [Achlya hypogyna]|uniref:Secreted protein n=1 Tax=Achlya hypogyna TaxID=1202772 RepID=A0A1V9ZP52_ACHHY|nr:hypothetical protein ACHHYP_04479 [Achlya hypogyna]
MRWLAVAALSLLAALWHCVAASDVSSYSSGSFATIVAPSGYAVPPQYANATVMALLDIAGGHMTFHWFTPTTIDSLYMIYVNGTLFGHAFGTTSDYTLEGLTCSTTYIVLVLDAINKNAVNILTATTTTATAPAMPPAPLPLHIASGYVTLSVQLPIDTGGLPIAPTVSIFVKTIEVSAIPVNLTRTATDEVTVYGLDGATEYYFSVIVTNTGYWSSPESYPVVVKTAPVTYPAPCPIPTPVTVTAGLVQLLLSPPLDTGGSDIMGYHVYIAVDGTYDEVAVTTTDTVFLYAQVNGAPWVPLEMYEVRVVATNELALCSINDTTRMSDPLFVTIPAPAVPPATAMNAYVVSTTASSVTIQILLPYDMQGTNAIGVYVTASTFETSKTIFVPTNEALVATVDGLSASTVYTVGLRLLTDLGNTTRYANALNATTAPGAQPEAPTPISTVNVTASSVDIVWALGNDSGGGPIAAYQVQVAAGGVTVIPGVWTPLSALDSVTQLTPVDNLLANTMYVAKFRVRNMFGLLSPASKALVFTTAAAAVPGSPTAVSADFVTGTMLQLSWLPPDNTGGTNDVLAYVATLHASNGTSVMTCNTTATACTLYGLHPSTYYTVTVTASNAIGPGTESVPVSILTSLMTAPGAVQELNATVATGGVIVLSWSPPRDTGDGSMSLVYIVARNGEFLQSIVGAGVMKYTDCNGILAGTTYKYAIAALNSVAMGPNVFTTIVSSVMQPPMVPTITFVRAQATALTWSFTQSCDTGGTNVLENFALWYPVNDTMPSAPMLEVQSTAAATTPSLFTIPLLQPNTSYTVVVWTANYAGGSDLVFVEATTATGIPGAPASHLVAATTFALQLSLDAPDNYTEDSWIFVASLSVNSTVVNTASLPGGTKNATLWTVLALLPETTYILSLQAIGYGGAGPVVNASYTTLPDALGYASFKTSSVDLVNADNTTLSLARYGGSGGTLVVPLNVTTIPPMYMTCLPTIMGTECSFSSTPSTLDANVTFEPGQIAHTLVLNTWNNVITNVPDFIHLTLPPVYNTSETATIRLFGYPGTVTAPTTFTIVENTTTTALPLMRTGGVSGDTIVTVAATSGSAVVDVDFFLPNTTIVIPAGESSAIVVITGIQQSPVYNPSGRTFQVVLTQMPLSFVPPMPPVIVNVAIVDEPTVTKPPLMCSNVALVSATGTVIGLQWVPPRFGVTGTVFYNVSVTPLSKTTLPFAVESSVPMILLYQLQPSSNYVVQVTAINAVGMGPSTPAQMFSTTPPTPPSVPLNLVASGISGGVVSLAWTPPNDTGGTPITGYVVTGANVPPITLGNTTNYTLYGLTASTNYTLGVAAISSVGYGMAPSALVAVTTAAAQPPQSPPAPILLSVTGGALTFAIPLPLDLGGAPVTTVSVYLATGLIPPTLGCSSVGQSCTAYGLAFGTTYTAYSVVKNIRGESAPSPSIPAATTAMMTIPGAPAKPVLITVSGSAVWLSWVPPLDFGGATAISGYQVLMRTEIFGAGQWSLPQTVATVLLPNEVPSVSQVNITGLQNQTTYGFSIVAMNPVSSCLSSHLYLPSPELTVKTMQPVAPMPPTAVTKVASTGTSVIIGWASPMDEGGTPLLSYNIYLVSVANATTAGNGLSTDPMKSIDTAPTTSSVIAVLPPSNTTYQLYNLPLLTQITLYVTATNIVGESAPSALCIASTTDVSPPSGPTDVQSAATTGGTITLVWRPPLDTGGAELLGYNVYRDDKLVSQLQITASYLDSNELSNNTAYTYAVAAVSTMYEGALSALTVSTRATADVPQPPTVSVAAITGGMCTIAVKAPKDLGGFPLQFFIVQLYNASSVLIDSATTTETAVSFYGLGPLATYVAKAVAVTAIGASQAQTISFLTTKVSVPSAPPVAILQTIWGGSAELWLSVPLDSGGEQVTMHLYQLAQIDSSSQLIERTYTISDTTLERVTGLVADSIYQFWTTAANTAGHGPSSPILNVATTSISQPGTVTQVMLVMATYRSLELIWSAPDDTGGDPNGIDRYSVSVSVNGSLVDLISTEATTMVLDDLEPTTTYTVQVAAINSALDGAWSAPADFVTDPVSPGTLAFATPTMSIREDEGYATVLVVRTNGTADTIGCNVTVTAHTAIGGVDFDVPNITDVTFEDGVTQQVVRVPIYHNLVYNNLASFVVALTNLTTPVGDVGDPASCTIYLLDVGDDGIVTFDAAEYTMVENSNDVAVTLLRSGGSSKQISIIVKVVGASIVTVTTPRVTFSDGQTTAVVFVSGIPNGLFDPFARVTTLELSVAPNSLGKVGAAATTTLRLLDQGDISGANDTNLPPRLLHATGGMLALQVPPPHDTGGVGQTITYFAVTVYALPSRAVLQVVNQSTPIFAIGGLNQSTTYGVSSSMWNSNGFASLGASTLWMANYSTEDMSPPGPPRDIALASATGGAADICWTLPLDTGGIPITGYLIYWAPAGSNNYSVVVDQSGNPSTCTHLSGLNLTARTTYPVAVQAINLASAAAKSGDIAFGNATTTTVSTPAELLLPIATTIGPDYIYVQFPVPNDSGGTTNLTYTLFVNTSNSSAALTSFDATGNVAVAPALTALTPYALTYTASNTNGTSIMSDPLIVRTKAPTIPSAPLALTRDAFSLQSGGCISVTWQAPLSSGGVPLTEYHIYNGVANGNATVFELGMTVPSSEQHATICGFNASTFYTFYVIAYNSLSYCFGSVNTLLASSPITVSTLPPTIPLNQSAPNVQWVTGGMVTLVWAPPYDAGGVPLREYLLYTSTSMGLVLLGTVANNATLTFDVYGLNRATSYQFQLAVVNAVGTSELSPVTTVATTGITSPSPPPNLQLLNQTGGAIGLTWSRALDTGGIPISCYVIYRNSNPVGQTSGLTYVDTDGLTASTKYSYLVAAANALLPGEKSTLLIASTGPPTVPAACTSFTVEALGGEIKVSWEPPTDSGGVDVLSFVATLYRNTTLVKSIETFTPQFDANFLLSLTTYTFTAVAVNRVGVGAQVSIEAMTTQLMPPGDIRNAPSLKSAFGGNFSVLLTVPANTGGASLLAFVVFVDGNLITTVDAANDTAVVSILSLNASTTYSVSYACNNSFGFGGPSPTTQITTASVNAPGGFYGAPVVTSVTSRTVSMTWRTPADTGGETLLSYELQALINGVAATSVIVTGTLSGVIGGLNIATTYSVRVRAWSNNVTLAGPWSLAAPTTTATGVPGALSFGFSSSSVIKNATLLQVPILRTVGTIGNISVTVTTPTLTYLGNQFYLNASALSQRSVVVQIPDGASGAVLNVGIMNDGVYRAVPSTFTLTMTTPTGGATLGANQSTIVTLLDAGNAGKVRFLAPAYLVGDTVGTFAIPLSRYDGSSSAIQVLATTAYNASNVYVAVPGVNYRLPTTPILFGDNKTSASLVVTIRDTHVYNNPPLGFTIGLSIYDGGAVLGDLQQVYIAIDNGNSSSAPGAPPTPTLNKATGGAVSLSIQLPVNRGSATAKIKSYMVTIVTVASQAQSKIVLAYTGESTYWIGGLVVNTSYTMAVAAAQSNVATYGPNSPAVTVATGNASSVGPPLNVAFSARTGGALTVSWDVPLDTGGVPIVNYRVQWTDATGAQQASTTNSSTRSFNIYGLLAMTAYPVKVKANNGVPYALCGGWGPFSATTWLSTDSVTLPGAPILNAWASALTGGSISISWSPPIDTGGTTIRGYHVFYKMASATSFTKANDGVVVNATSFAIAPLAASTSYTFLVVAENIGGAIALPGFFSIGATGTTVATTANCTAYLVPGSSVLLGKALFTVGSLVTKSAFTVAQPNAYASLVNTSGFVVGAQSNMVTLATTISTVPAVPPPPVLITTTGGAVYANLSSPADTGGIPITGFKVQLYVTSNGTTMIVDASAVSNLTRTTNNDLQATAQLKIAQLTPKSSYSIAVVALNSYSGCTNRPPVFSPVKNFTTDNATAPGPPTALSVVTTTGAGLSLVWGPPFDTGGVQILLYTLQILNRTTRQWTTVYSNATAAYRIAGLETLTTYSWRLQATNMVNISEWSAVWNLSTSGPSAPGPCKAPYSVSATGGHIQVAWQPPADNGGSPILEYLVGIDDGANGPFTLTVALTTTYDAYGLVALTSYRVKIFARNVQGVGEPSPVALLKTGAPSPPALPVTPVVADATGGAVSLTLFPPKDLGGIDPDLLVFKVMANNINIRNVTYAQLLASEATSAPVSHRRLTSAASIVVGGLSPTTLYAFSLVAVSSAGSSPPSASKVGTTSAPTAPEAPAAPTAPQVYAGSIVVAWLSPEDQGGSPVTAFTLYMLPARTQICMGLIWSCVVSGLTPNTAFSFNVVATNAIGSSPASALLTVTTKQATSSMAPRNLALTSVALSGTAALVSWEAPIDTGGQPLSNYRLSYTAPSSSTRIVDAGTSTSFTLTGLSASTTYTMSCSAQTSQVSAGPSSRVVTFSTPSGSGAPVAPVVTCVSSTSIGLMWEAIQGAAGYTVYRGAQSFRVQVPYFTDTQLSPSTSYTYTVTSTNSQNVESAGVMLSWSTAAASTGNAATCMGTKGYITQGTYGNLWTRTWTINPTGSWSNIRLEVLSFDTECDYDRVRVEQYPYDGSNVLWTGGCSRPDPFFIWSSADNTPLRIIFSTDDSVVKGGFTIRYDVDADDITDTTVTCPASATYGICTGHGRCSPAGTCSCDLGFTGEDCSNRLVCCVDKAICSHAVCSLPPQNVILVSAETGDDVLGTGQMLNTSEVGGAVAKPFATLSKALAAATDASTIFVYPGNYGPASCGLSLVRRTVNIVSLLGSSTTTLTCTGTFGLDSDSSTITVTGIAIHEASRTTSGAAIATRASVVTLQDVVVFKASSVANGGGAWFSSGSVVTLNASLVTNSTATDGGGVYLHDSTLALYGSFITANAADYGGGIFVQGTATVIADSDTVVANNTAHRCGGGLALSGSGADSAIVDGVEIAKNVALTGGGVCILGGVPNVQWGAAVTNNSADTHGGGIYIDGDITFAAVGASISYNHANGDGGGVYFSAHGGVEAVDALVIANNTAANGAGICVDQSTIELVNVTLLGNVATSNGGGMIARSSIMTFTACDISGNTAGAAGGGISLVNSSATGNKLSVVTNSAQNGGGMDLIESTVLSATLTNNRARGYGGGAHLTLNSSLQNVATAFSRANAGGGGVAARSGTFTFSGVDITHCSSELSGGGLEVDNGTLHLASSFVSASIAIADGGGVNVVDSTIVGLVNVSDCVAGRNGGGVSGSGTVVFDSVAIAGCKSTEGGGLALNGANFSVANTIITYCMAANGGAMAFNGTTAHMQTVRLYKSSSTISGGGLYLATSRLFYSVLEVSLCITSGAGGGAMINASYLEPILPTDIAEFFNNTATQKGGNCAVVGVSSLTSMNARFGSAPYGGGLYTNGATLDLFNIAILQSTASNVGGGAYFTASNVTALAMAVTQNVVLAGNNTFGGGVALQDTILTHTNVSVTENKAPKYGGLALGGLSKFVATSDAKATISGNIVCTPSCGNGANVGIVAAAVATLHGVDLTLGRADFGGSVYVEPTGTVTLVGASVTSNLANIGGAVFVDMRATATLEDVYIAHNIASSGGGIRVAGQNDVVPPGISYLAITNAELYNNSAIEGGGGAIYVTRTNFEASGLTVSSNSATAGAGGGFFIDIASFGVVNSSTFTDNIVDAKTSGGVFYVGGGSEVGILSSNITGAFRSTANHGGLVAVVGSSTVASLASIVDTSLLYGQARFGAGIYADAATVILMRVTIANGAAIEFGGGIYANDKSSVFVSLSTIANNSAVYNGGGVYLSGSSGINLENSELADNTAEDQGGAIFIAIGSENKLELTSCSVARNVATGLGSALYASRDSTTTITSSNFTANGGQTMYGYSEGGPVYFDSNYAFLTRVLFEANLAEVGGALEIYGSATIGIYDCTFINNTAITNGGALRQMSGGLTMKRTEFVANSAIGLGGAVYLGDASNVTMTDVQFTANVAPTGGAVYVTDTSSLQLKGGGMSKNQATQASDAVLTNNNASNTGGGYYVTTTARLTHKRLIFNANTAPLARDVYWRYDSENPEYMCSGCTFATAGGVATDPMKVILGWWPKNVTSGVDMSINLTELADTSLYDPKTTTVVWPTIRVLDFYDAQSILDEATTCRIYKDLREPYSIQFLPAGQLTATRGYVTFEHAHVEATSKAAPFHFDAVCTLYNGRTLPLDVYVQVNPCNAGYMLDTGKCVQCPQGSFSLDGIGCHRCPIGATCVTSSVVGTGVSYTGVDYPTTQVGSYMSYAPASSIGALCDDKSSFPSGDPCPGGSPGTRLERIRSCLNATDFSQYWPSDRVFTCSSGLSFYSCTVHKACLADVGVKAATTTAPCAKGFRNVLCSACEDGYEKLADGTCDLCLPSSPDLFYTYLSIPIVMLVVAVVGAYLYLMTGTDKVMMAHAKAAKAGVPYSYGENLDKPASLLGRWMQALRRRWRQLSSTGGLHLRKTPNNLFGVKRMGRPAVTINPEKFKILVSFFQIFASFKDAYNIEWPSDVASFMQFFLKFNFSFLAIPHIDCVLRYSFYVDYEITLGITVIAFTLLFLSYRLGILLYTRKLHRIPRACPVCGLPNLDTVENQNGSRRNSVARERTRAIKWRQRLREFLFDKDDMVSALPTYAAVHRTCPTARVIETDVVRNQMMRTNIRLWQARIRLRMNFLTYRNKCWKICFWLALVLYPAVSRKILDLYNCVEVGGATYLIVDTNILCHTPAWILRAGVGGIGCFVWILGVPVLCLVILLRERHAGVHARMKQLKDGKHELARDKWIAAMKIDYEAQGMHWNERNMAFVDDLLVKFMKKRNLQNPSVVAGVGFIYAAYKDEFWFFEIIDLIRKLLMNGVIVFMGQGSINQVVIGLIIIFAYMSILLAVQPYKERSNNVVSSVAQMQLFVTLFAGLLIRMNVGNAQSLNLTQVSIVIIVTNCFTIGVIAIGVVLEKIKEMRLHRRIGQRKYTDDVRYHVERLWWRAISYALAEVYLTKFAMDEKPVASFRVVLELARRQKVAAAKAVTEAADADTDALRDPEPTTFEIEPPRP